MATCSLLAGPSDLRFLARQPSGRLRRSGKPLQGHLPLLRPSERLALQWQPELWRGAWQAFGEPSGHRSLQESLREAAGRIEMALSHRKMRGSGLLLGLGCHGMLLEDPSKPRSQVQEASRRLCADSLWALPPKELDDLPAPQRQ